MTPETTSSIKERISIIDQQIEEYKKCIEALEKEKINLQNEEKQFRLLQNTLENEDIRSEEVKNENCSINRASSAKEKAEFLFDIFYSRRDVYALRSKNKENKTTYYPKCHYFWSEVCKKRQMKEKGMFHLFNKDVWESLYKQCFTLS